MATIIPTDIDMSEPLPIIPPLKNDTSSPKSPSLLARYISELESQTLKVKDQATFLSHLRELDRLIKIHNIRIDIVRYIKRLLIEGDSDPPNLHMILSGHPGKHKAEIANCLTKIWISMGLITETRDETIQVTNRTDFVARYVGQTAKKTRKYLETMDQSVLYIDEAHNLIHDPNDDFGVDALDAISKYLESHNHPTVIFDNFPEYSILKHVEWCLNIEKL